MCSLRALSKKAAKPDIAVRIQRDCGRLKCEEGFATKLRVLIDNEMEETYRRKYDALRWKEQTDTERQQSTPAKPIGREANERV